MAAYAKIYGFVLIPSNKIINNEENYTYVGDGYFLTNSDFEMLEEILNNEY